MCSSVNWVREENGVSTRVNFEQDTLAASEVADNSTDGCGHRVSAQSRMKT